MMNTGKKIIYTETAKERLEKFHMEVNQEMERYLQDRKYVPGDDFIEVTASDIDEIAYRFRIERPSRTSIKTLIPIVYSIVGVVMTVIGVFYNQLTTLLQGDPKRLIFITSGLVMLLASWFYLYLIRIKERRNELDRVLNEELKRIKISPLDKELSRIEKSVEISKSKNDLTEKILIHSAKYYGEKNYFNVTAKIKELVAEGIFEFTVSNDLMGGDPNFGKQKTLEIECTINGTNKKIAAFEGATVKLE